MDIRIGVDFIYEGEEEKHGVYVSGAETISSRRFGEMVEREIDRWRGYDYPAPVLQEVKP